MSVTRVHTHLDQLEAESIRILRETVAECRNPVLLYSIGKDSSVLLHLLLKAFYPAKPPLPMLHVNTTWKFREMIEFRDRIARETGVRLIEHINPDGVGKTDPVHAASKHTHIMKTLALRQALAELKFDAAIGGARRDEDPARAKERVFSLRGAGQRWEPRKQRPEPWGLFNTRLASDESMRVFPLSDWTELDVWLYIRREGIEVVPLYFAKERPTFVRNGALLVRDDERVPLEPGEQLVPKMVRFRTLGCWPLTAAVESQAANLDEIIGEMLDTRQSERAGRIIDLDPTDSMERKKREGYF
ncbi:MAG TPA: sulfate adenylyltransferase subunit CysD [Rhodanobacteraceae bacterium]|jgi:sulfate adenylyltransferase subunit 2|nr:sulfate adenylyltransferase subunit CysD [Rhodanobacteraceae bacterium]